VARGHRLIYGCSHSTGSSTVAALVCQPSPDHSHTTHHLQTSQITIYGWSTDVERLVKGPFCLVVGVVWGMRRATLTALGEATC